MRKIESKCKIALINELIYTDFFKNRFLKDNVIYGFISGSTALGLNTEDSDIDITLVIDGEKPYDYSEFDFKDKRIHINFLRIRDFLQRSNTSILFGGMYIDYSIDESLIYYINPNYKGVYMLLNNIIHEKTFLNDIIDITLYAFWEDREHLKDEQNAKKWYKILYIFKELGMINMTNNDIMNFKLKPFSNISLDEIYSILNKSIIERKINENDLVLKIDEINNYFYNLIKNTN